MISIEYKNLADYIMFKLDKLENSFCLEELEQIEEIFLDYKKDKIEDLEMLLNFPNLKELHLYNFYLSDYNFRVLKQIKKLTNITFFNCGFSDVDFIALLDIDTLDIVECEIKSFKFITIMDKLKSLTINNEYVDCFYFNSLKKLEYIDLANCKIDNLDKMDCQNIKEIYINGTNIEDVSFLLNKNKLTKVGLSKKQIILNKNTINLLFKKGVKIYEDGVIELVGDDLW